MGGERREEAFRTETEIKIKLQQYHLVLSLVLAAAAGAPPGTLWRPNQSTAPSLHWFCTRRTPRRSCLIGRWSRRGLGSWTGSQDAAAAWCEATR